MGETGSSTAVVPMSVEELNRPAEQGLRDARLVIVGVMAGLAGQAIWELGRQLLQLGRVGARRLLVHARSRQAESDEDSGTLSAETASVPSSADSAPMDDEGENPPEPARDA